MQKTFHIDLNIYEETFLQQAITDFSGITSIILDGNTVTLDGENDAQIHEIFYEYMNYTLSLILNYKPLGL